MSTAGTGTHLRLAMRLPREVGSVATARRTLTKALDGIGVAQECRDDLALALSEACSNAVEHARIGHGYDVVVTVGPHRCVVDVVDNGVGLDARRLDGGPAPMTARRGRGLQLIRAVTDELHLRRIDPHGLALRMIKTVAWVRDAPAMWADGRHPPWVVVHP